MTAELDLLKHIAFHLTMTRVAHGLSKRAARAEGMALIHSLATENQYRDHVFHFLEWRAEIGRNPRQDYLKEEMQEYLFASEEFRHQRQIDSIRQALECVFGVTLERAKSELTSSLAARAYTAHEVVAVLNFQSAKDQLSTKLCLRSGLRAHELITLRRASELSPSPDRPWRQDLFSNNVEFVLYTVTGKGGLKRYVAIPHELADELETYRLTKPENYVDRKISYQSHYRIGRGQAFSQSFTDAAKKALGFSHGAHGLRHSYAQARLLALKKAGYSISDILLILSQELGHFRKDICLAYLR